MLTWILTSSVIAAFSAAALKLFDETAPNNLLRNGPWRSNWERMNDSDLDLLLAPFSQGAEEETYTNRKLIR
jgi:hypothetical protein